jgi:hypothetical protein
MKREAIAIVITLVLQMVSRVCGDVEWGKVEVLYKVADV